MQEFIEQLQSSAIQFLPRVLIALAVLVVGWLVALAIAALVRALLRKTRLDDRLARSLHGDREGRPPEVARVVSRIVFWVLMIFVVVAFFSILELAAVTAPLNSFLGKVFAFLPNVLAATILLLVAWLAARILRFLVEQGIAATSLEKAIGQEMPAERRVSLARTLGNIVYWLVLLLFLPLVLSTLQLAGLLAPVQEMLNKVLAFLPNLLGATVILIAGWLVARIVQRLVVNLLAAIGVDNLGERVGLDRALGERRLSGAIGLILYVLILVPVVVAALNQLEIETVTHPASEMLNRLLVAIPLLFGAALVLVVAWFVGRLVAGLISNLLNSIGFDAFLERIGLTGAMVPSAASTGVTEGEEATGPEIARQPSELVGWIALVTVMLFATIEAMRLLEFDALAAIVTEFTRFAGNVLLGLVIFLIGFWLARLAADAIRSSRAANAGLLATYARGAIVVLATAMALRQAGLAEDIINLAFGVVLGAVAVAAAIAFGIGGRDIAGRYLSQWTSGLEEGGTRPPHGPGRAVPPGDPGGGAGSPL